MEPYNKPPYKPNSLTSPAVENRPVTISDIKELSAKPPEKDPTISKAPEGKPSGFDKPATAKEGMADKAGDMKDAVVDKALEMKDAVVEKSIEVADVASEKFDDAKELLSETLGSAGATATRLARAMGHFAATNAVPLTMVGLSAGWMIYTARRPAKLNVSTSIAARDTRGSNDETTSLGTSSRTTDGSTALASERATTKVSALTTDMMTAGKQKATRGVQVARDGLKVAQTVSRDFAKANPLMLGLATLAIGVSIGALLPSTDRETKLLQPARAKVDRLLGEARDAASDVIDVAKDTAHEVIATT